MQKKRSVADGMIDPDRDLYAIPSQDGNDIYFLSLVDILTHYGKQQQQYFLIEYLLLSQPFLQLVNLKKTFLQVESLKFAQ